MGLKRNYSECDVEALLSVIPMLVFNVLVQVLHAIQVAEKLEKPGLKDIFTDVYDVPPSNLREQDKSLRHAVGNHREEYPNFQF